MKAKFFKFPVQFIKLNLVLLRLSFTIIFQRKKIAEVSVRMVEFMGPVYIKIGQILSTRGDILSADFSKALASLREQVSQEKRTHMTSIINKAFDNDVDKIFSSFDYTPIACGSVAQVYHACLRNGEQVAVKVLRPNMNEKISANFSLIYILLKISELVSSTVRTIHLRGLIDEIQALLISQTSLRNEAAHYDNFHLAYDKHPKIKIPKIYQHLCSENILVIEFIDAIHPYETDKLDIPKKQLAANVDDLLDTMVFIKGLCHADLHPGNFFWDKQGRIVLIDLGLAHQFTQLERNHVMTFYLSMAEGYYDFCTEYFIKYFVTPKDIDLFDSKQRQLATNEACEVIKKQYRDSNGQPNFSVIFNNLIKIMYKYKLQLINNYSKIFLTLITVEGYLYSLDPDFDMIENARKSRMKQAEYTAVPLEAERMVLGDFGTYSTAMFASNTTDTKAWQVRDDYILNSLDLKKGDFLLDVGCGRGNLLHKAKTDGINGVGITISRFEHEACNDREITSVWSSWEDFEQLHGERYPKADAITAIEMLFHLANLHENREGLLAHRLTRFFEWTNERLKNNGKLFLQTLNVVPEFIMGTHFQDEYDYITHQLPWIGFTSINQIENYSSPWFDISQTKNHSSDLSKTFNYMKNNINLHDEKLKSIVDIEMYKYMKKELDILIEFSDKGILQLNRLLLTKRAA